VLGKVTGVSKESACSVLMDALISPKNLPALFF
jgi:hypothetical protein